MFLNKSSNHYSLLSMVFLISSFAESGTALDVSMEMWPNMKFKTLGQLADAFFFFDNLL